MYRALGVQLLLLLMGAAALHAAIPADTSPAAAGAAVLEADARVAAATQAAAAATAAAAAQAAAPPVTAATCKINIAANPQGAISKASMECSGGPVTIGVHPQLPGLIKQGLRGAVWDSECARSLCLIRFCGNTSVSISNSTVTGVSNITLPGLLTVVCLAHDTRMVLRNTSISSNKATALVTAGQSWLHVLNSTIAVNNGYTQPGGIMSLGNSTVIVASRSAISGNTGVMSCGGIVAADNSTVVVSGGSVVSRNTALNAAGGGIAVVSNGTVVVSGGSIISGNTALTAAGGGVAVFANGTMVASGGSIISGNTAVNAVGGGVLAADNSTVVVSGGSVISGNTVLNASGGGVAVSGNATLVLSGASRLTNNTSPRTGGGLTVLGSGQAHIEGESMVCNNTSLAGGGGGILVVEQSKLVVVGGSVVCNNTGGLGGGGIAVSGNGVVTIHNSSIRGNSAYASGGGFLVGDQGFVDVFDSIIANNTSLQDEDASLGGAAFAATGDATVQLFNGTQLLGNKAVGMPGGAFVIDQNASLTLAAGVSLIANTIVANASSPLVPYGSDGVAVQASKLAIEHGVLGQNGLLTKCNRSIVLFRRPCGVGEYDGGAVGPCMCCPSFTYSFQPNATACQQCPAYALCSADVVSPFVGYWHSSPRSLQMHRCPVTGSCQRGGVCSAGYTGNLCGQCSEGFGTTAPLRCGKCMVPKLQLGVYIVLVAATVLFVTMTVHFTWQDNKVGERSLRPSDLIKVLVQFLQYTVILGSISVPWPAFLVGMFTAATAVFGVGSGQALSLDCWLPHFLSSKLPLALQRQLSVFVGALVIAVACVVLMNLLHVCNRVWKAITSKPTMSSSRQQAPRLHFWSRLRVTLLVTAFFAYPTLVRAALSFFACLRIDDASEQPYPEYSIRNHTSGYWVSAIQQECFAGWHRSWALGFGLPAVLLLCVGVPVSLFSFLRRNQAKTSNPQFKEHYGFLFRNYTESKPWWEAVWAAQTVLLTAVSVFHFTLHAYYALLLMSLILFMSVAAQIALRPYEQPILHRLHMASTCCLFLLVWLSLALFDTPVVVMNRASLVSAHTAIGAVMVVLACSFVMWCMVTIVRVASPVLRDCASSAAVWVQDCTGSVAGYHHPKASKLPGRQVGAPQQPVGSAMERAEHA